jgi:hypothetical protein
MRKITLIILVPVILLQCSIKTAIVAYYQINQEYIASVLCENKNNTTMNCKGKCYLNKKISEQENQEAKLASILKELKDTNGFLPSVFQFSIDSYGNSLSDQNSAYLSKNYSSPFLEILQPPC